MSAKDKLREQQQNYLDLCLADEPYRRVTVGDKSNARVELAQLRAELAALRARLAALENDIVCAFCGAHYHADDVPPQHYLTCEASPLVQRIAEQARARRAASSARSCASSTRALDLSPTVTRRYGSSARHKSK